LPERFGKCDREDNCLYHLNPYKVKFGKDEINICRYVKPRPRPKTVYIPESILDGTLNRERYKHNVFFRNLSNNVQYPFTDDDIKQVAAFYRLGTIMKGYLSGSVTFPYIDINNKVRAIQVRKFNTNNHGTHTSFIHKVIEQNCKENQHTQPDWLDSYNQNDKIVSCLFGEHLLSLYPHHAVALVEAPKTAIYGALYFGLPQHGAKLIWLSVFNKDGFTVDKLSVLQGRNVIVYPDLSNDGSTFKKWKLKAAGMTKINFTFSTFLEDHATVEERCKGLDLADYLIGKDWRAFRAEEVQPCSK
jgi:hypothetical protein